MRFSCLNWGNLIKSFQKIDGSWPWKWQHDKPGGVVETVAAIDILSKYNITKVRPAISFICSIQREDGGWSENPRLTSFIPNNWIFWRTDCSSAFFTGKSLFTLIKSGYKDSIFVKKGINYLQETQNEEGGWPLNSDPQYTRSDPICTNSAIKAFIEIEHYQNSKILKKALKSIEKNYSKWMKILAQTSEPLTACSILDSLIILDPKSSKILDLLNYIIRIQREDGGWGWNKEPSDPDITLKCFELTTRS
ncbi:MAG: prenyltransferase/squalene oxidase repeat-containing protein [Candidatus Hodarchaeota archaeon]